MQIAALLPVYREPRSILSIATRLSEENVEGSSIHVVVDGEVTEALAPALDALRILPRVEVHSGRPHLGKAKALNLAVAELEADCLLFIDNDIEIPRGSSLLRGCLSLLEGCELAELPKIGKGRGIVAAMCRYEFLANVVATEYLVGKTGRVPSINGAAFAMRRSLFTALGGFRGVVNEDMDLAARAFLEGARFGFDPALRVLNELPEKAGDWFRQRRRWAINTALWSELYMARVLRHDPALGPALGLSGFLFPLPLIAFATGCLVPLIPASLAGLGSWNTAFLCLAGGLAAFAPVAAWFGRRSRRYASPFNPAGFLLFTLVYLPIWGLASLMGMIAISAGKIPELDWKHDESESEKALAEARARPTKERRRATKAKPPEPPAKR